MNRTHLTRAAGALLAAALVALWRDNMIIGNDGLSNRRRRHHARRWANGVGRKPTKAEMACLRERINERQTIEPHPPVP